MNRSPAHPRTFFAIVAACLFLLPSGVRAQNAGATENRVASELREGNNGKALELLSSSLQKYPGDAQLWIMQGVAYSRQQRRKEALAAFRDELAGFEQRGVRRDRPDV